jgi:hypothetical protein
MHHAGRAQGHGERDLWLAIYWAEGRETKFDSSSIAILGAAEHVTLEGGEVEEPWEPCIPLYQTSD